MKPNERIKKRAALVLAKIEFVARHIRNVEDNCLVLGKKFIELGRVELGHRLIANGYIHDASKFHGIEFEYLSVNNPTEEDKTLKLKLAIHHHNTTNPHHPEFWAGGIKEMPDVYVAEMVADWKARSEEFGTSLRDWIEESATKRFGFTKEDKVYKEIMEYVGLLCQTPFSNTTNT
jgi:hypothetical protein